MNQYVSLVCYVVQHMSHLSDGYLSVLNPLLDPNQLIFGSGQHRPLPILLKHAKHASPDYQQIVHPLHRLPARGAFFSLKALCVCCVRLLTIPISLD